MLFFGWHFLFYPLLLQLFSQYISYEPVKIFFDTYYRYDGIAYNAFFCILIFFFTYFYTAITFNPKDLADNIRKYGGFITGVRPGNSTVQYLEKIITTLTFTICRLIQICRLNTSNTN